MTLMASAGRIFKSIAHGLFVFLLSVTAFIGIALVTLSLTATDQTAVKSLPQRAGVYENVTDNLLLLTSQGDSSEQGNSQDEGLNALFNAEALEPEPLKETVRTVYPPRYWQEKFEGFIDDVYAWLEDEQPELTFELDFNDKKEELSAALTDEITDQLAALPTCQPNEIPREFDVLSATCLPPGVSASQAGATVKRQLNSSDGPLAQDLRVSSDELDITEETKTNLQNVHDAASALPFIVGGLLLTFAALVTLTGRTWLHGLRRAGLTLFSAGLISWISWFILNQIGNFSPSLGNNEAERQIAQDIVTPLVQTVTATIANTGMWVSLVVVIAGALIWLGSYIWHKVHHHAQAEEIAQRAVANNNTSPDATLPKPVDPKT